MSGNTTSPPSDSNPASVGDTVATCSAEELVMILPERLESGDMTLEEMRNFAPALRSYFQTASSVKAELDAVKRELGTQKAFSRLGDYTGCMYNDLKYAGTGVLRKTKNAERLREVLEPVFGETDTEASKRCKLENQAAAQEGLAKAAMKLSDANLQIALPVAAASVNFYAARNTGFHNKCSDLVSLERWSELASKIDTDLSELSELLEYLPEYVEPAQKWLAYFKACKIRKDATGNWVGVDPNAQKTREGRPIYKNLHPVSQPRMLKKDVELRVPELHSERDARRQEAEYTARQRAHTDSATMGLDFRRRRQAMTSSSLNDGPMVHQPPTKEEKEDEQFDNLLGNFSKSIMELRIVHPGKAKAILAECRGNVSKVVDKLKIGVVEDSVEEKAVEKKKEEGKAEEDEAKVPTVRLRARLRARLSTLFRRNNGE